MKSSPVIAFAFLLVCTFAVSAFAIPNIAPLNQVVFEGNGSGTFNTEAMPFGFSVRCYGSNCVGAIIMGEASTVSYVTGTIAVVAQDTYMMSLSTSPATGATTGPTVHLNSPVTVSCSLVNSPPLTQGEGNKVTMTCSTPAGSGTSADAMVEVSSSGQ
jgi:hypothetical protein